MDKLIQLAKTNKSIGKDGTITSQFSVGDLNIIFKISPAEIIAINKMIEHEHQIDPTIIDTIQSSISKG